MDALIVWLTIIGVIYIIARLTLRHHFAPGT
jgi:hypothetical protein